MSAKTILSALGIVCAVLSLVVAFPHLLAVGVIFIGVAVLVP
jgi:hypothetical protein